ncbi:MAG TPA: hypothetical protein VFK05_10345 [Polyangiaceae bacterium]|nr:hypothetical protein [Polyangiaceae bacterium]
MSGRGWAAASALLIVSGAQLARGEPAPVRAFVQLASGQWLNPGQDHVALSRDSPGAESGAGDSEAIRLVFAAEQSAPPKVRVTTWRANGRLLDTLAEPKLSPVSCPPSAAAFAFCFATPPVRLTPDRLDRDYPLARERSLEAELGGQLTVEVGAEPRTSFFVGAPHSELFSNNARLSVKLRVRVLRITPGGAPSIGSDTQSALSIARKELEVASKLWAQCGIDLHGPSGPDIQVVDPPPIQLVAIGCDSGLPASGGEINLRVRGRRVKVVTRSGELPNIVAEHLRDALFKLGVNAKVSRNPRIAPGASGASDVLLGASPGRAIAVEAEPGAALSTDPTLGVCLGEVDLGNGLSHFVENDAAAGTVEERALIKAFDDGDPSTIEVFIIPSFDQSGRIGESFIDEDGAGIQNTVIIDRAALRAGPRSYALAHELGHVLLDLPGHPDDYGVDQASSLMDSDASDASVFGPRRLSLADCERALLESGPNARIPLAQPWPLSRRIQSLPEGTPVTSPR